MGPAGRDRAVLRAGRVTDGCVDPCPSRMGRGHRNRPARPLTNGAALWNASERGVVLLASARGRRRLRSGCSDLRLCGWKPHTDVVDDPQNAPWRCVTDRNNCFVADTARRWPRIAFGLCLVLSFGFGAWNEMPE